MRVILDCDPGNGIPGSDIDDGLALGLILASPEFALEAVTVVGGNTPVDVGVRSALNMLEIAGVELPVHRGAARPILEDQAFWRIDMDARGRTEPATSLWRDVPKPAPRRHASTEGAAQAIVRIVNAHPGEMAIIAVGPLTNIAQAILLDPELPGKVKQLSIMGGGFGMWHRPQELNFCYDPEAARIVMLSGAKILLVPIDTTIKTRMLLEQAAQLTASGNRLISYLGRTTEPWIRYLEQVRNTHGCALHDPLAVAVLLDRALVKIDRVRVDVELAGSVTRGRPVSWIANDPTLRGGALRLPQVDPVEVAVDVDDDAFVSLMMQRLSAFGGNSNIDKTGTRRVEEVARQTER